MQLAQQFVVHTSYGTIAVSHNGELVNSSVLRRSLLDNGVGLTTGSDSELITQCLSQPPPEELRHPRIRKMRGRKGPVQNANNGNASPLMRNSMDSNNTTEIEVWTKPRSGSELSIDLSSVSYSCCIIIYYLLVFILIS